MIIPFATPDGTAHTYAPPRAQHTAANGAQYVWVRTSDGDITKAFQRGDA